MKGEPFLDYPSVSEFIYTALIEMKSRDEIMQTLTDNGYTKLQAMNLYQMNLARIFHRHETFREKETI